MADDETTKEAPEQTEQPEQTEPQTADHSPEAAHTGTSDGDGASS